jgi:hypothetical protein
MSDDEEEIRREPPSWLRMHAEGMYYGPDGQLVIYPAAEPGVAILDRAFTAQQLRDIADWIDRSEAGNAD